MSTANITVIGSLGGDPELRYTPSGAAVSNFNVAQTERIKDGDNWKDGVTTWYRVSVWRQYAENVASSLHKGDQVFVTGTLKNRQYEKDGQTRTSLEIDANDVGPTLRFATATPQKAGRSGSGNSSNNSTFNGNTAADPWGSAPQNAEAPF